MRVIALVLAVSAVALARPQFQLSDRGFEGLQAALDGRIPVAISSGQLLYAAVDDGSALRQVDLGRALPPATGAGIGAGIGDNLIRTDPSLDLGAGINDLGQGVLDFGLGALEFTGGVVAGLGEVADGALQGIADLATAGAVDIRTPDTSFRSLPEVVAPANTIADAPIAAAPTDLDLGGAIGDIGEGALLFGQGVIDAVGEVTVGLGAAAEQTLRSLSEASNRQAEPAVIIVDEAASSPASDLGQGINEFGQGVLDFGLGIRDAISESVGAVGQAAEDTLQGIVDFTGIADIEASNTVAGGEATVFRSAVEVAPVEITPIEAAPLEFASVDIAAADDTPVASGRTVILVAEPELVMTITEAPRPPAPTISASDNTDSSLVVAAGVPLNQVAEPVPAIVVVEAATPNLTEAPAPTPVEAPAPAAVEAPAPAAVEATAPNPVEAPAPVTVEEPALVANEEPVASGRTILVVAEPEAVITITESAEPIPPASPSSPAPTTVESVPTATEVSSTSSPIATESESTVASTVTEAAPAVERIGAVAAEDTAEVSPVALDEPIVSPVAPEEAVAAPATPEEPAAPEEAIVAPATPDAGVPLTLLTGSIDQTQNEIVPSAPQDNQNTSEISDSTITIL